MSLLYQCDGTAPSQRGAEVSHADASDTASIWYNSPCLLRTSVLPIGGVAGHHKEAA
jgi:hypothetical protein